MVPSTVDEMKAWLSLYLDMGLVTKPSISSYWSTEAVLSSPFFPSVMWYYKVFFLYGRGLCVKCTHSSNQIPKPCQYNQFRV